MSNNIKERLKEWRKLARLLAKYKKSEFALRKDIAEATLKPDDFNALGNGKVTVEDGNTEYAIVRNTVLGVDKAVLEAIYQDLSDEEKAVIKYEPKLDLRKYRNLPEDSILHDAVVSRLAAPIIKLKVL